MPAVTTDRQIAALKPAAQRTEVTIGGSRGLSVVVYPTGAKSFVLRYVALNGERRRLRLGNYPGLSLADAKDKAAGLRVEVLDGSDPGAERAAARKAARTGDTLEELAEAYWAAAAKGLHGGRKMPKRASTIGNEKGLWSNHIKTELGQRRFAEIKRADVKSFMRDLATKSELRPATVASIGAVLSNILGFAVHEDRMEANPALGLTRPLGWDSRSRLFDDNALHVILETLEEASAVRDADGRRGDKHARMGPEMALGTLFLILTLSRRTEAAGALWAEIDLRTKLWTIPADRSKAKHIHVVPLSQAAIDILERAKALPSAGGPYVFPSPSDPEKHLDPHAITRAIARICERRELPPGSPHDFRRSGATTLTGERYGQRRFIVGKVLGHTSHEGSAVTSVYDRNEYLAEKRIALAAWAQHIAMLRDGLPEEGNVIAFASATTSRT